MGPRRGSRRRSVPWAMRSTRSAAPELSECRPTRPGRWCWPRADIDALPVTENTGLDNASGVQGVMHACGREDTRRTPGIRVRQPYRALRAAEETAAGAKAMVADGRVEKIPKPDVALAQHVMPVEAGKTGTTAGRPFPQTTTCASPSAGTEPTARCRTTRWIRWSWIRPSCSSRR